MKKPTVELVARITTELDAAELFIIVDSLKKAALVTGESATTTSRRDDLIEMFDTTYKWLTGGTR